jgi:DNA-binding MarR family transcriptional regulator
MEHGNQPPTTPEETARCFTSMFMHSHQALIRARKMAGTTDHLMAYAYRLMGYVLQAGPVPITEIGRQLGIAKSNVSTAVNRLVREDFLERIPCPTDRRVIRIDVTSKGRAEMVKAQNRLIKTFAGYFAGLTVEDQRRLNRALGEVEVILEQLERHPNSSEKDDARP